MSNVVFPALPGLTWDIGMSPQFDTKVQRAVSGYEVRAAYRIYPLWTFKLKSELLRDTVANNELKPVIGFFNARQGSFDSFLHSAPSDNAVTAQAFGTGTGAQLAFHLVRSYGGYAEPVSNLNGAAAIYVNGVLKTLTTDYTISATGLVTFVVAPGNGLPLTWTGAFYY